MSTVDYKKMFYEEFPGLQTSYNFSKPMSPAAYNRLRELASAFMAEDSDVHKADNDLGDRYGQKTD